MVMPRKRFLEDANQPYVYVWRLNGVVLWVGCGKNNRGRPTCKSSWNGRPTSLIEVLEKHRHSIEVEVIPCTTKQEAVGIERKLIAELKPTHNTAPQAGGWKGMHSTQGLDNIRRSRTNQPTTDKQREVRRQNMIALNAKRRS